MADKSREAVIAGLGGGAGAATAGVVVDAVFPGMLGDYLWAIVFAQFLIAGLATFCGVYAGKWA